MGYRCTHFRIEELVSKKTFERWGDRCWEFFQPGILQFADTFVAEFGTTTINDWLYGGILNGCGLRDMYTVGGADFSQHKLGGALDLHPKKISVQEAHAHILARPDRFPMLTCLERIEDTPTWIHGDKRNHNADSQIIVVPGK